MRTRLFIFDNAGRPLLGFDGGSTAGHAARFVADNLAQLANAGYSNCIVIEFDPLGDADDAMRSVQSLHEHRLEFRQRPDGRREIVDVARWCEPDDPALLRRPAKGVRAFRVIHAADDVANTRAPLRGTPP